MELDSLDRYLKELDEGWDIIYDSDWISYQNMNEEEVRRIVKQFITEIGALSKSDIGRCMGPLLERLNGRAESSLISKLVIEELS